MRGELDVHPDDLLHRARGAGGLSREEQLYVDAHLQDCGTCRFLLNAGRAFDAEATERSPVKLGRLVDSALQRTGMDRGRRARRPSRRLAVAGLAAAVMLGGVAFAGYWGVRHQDRGTASRPTSVFTTAPAPLPRARRSVERLPPVPLDESTTGASPTAPPVAAPVRTTAPPVRRVALRRAPRAPDTAAGLFAAANRARRTGDVAAATSAYDTLWERFRGSPEALASRAICGRWMLDRGLPAAAIPLYREYLAASPAGSLNEEALVGLALAEEQTGQPGTATQTWRRLLAEHPLSVHAARARARIRALDAGGPP
jgi:hypothetical protein